MLFCNKKVLLFTTYSYHHCIGRILLHSVTITGNTVLLLPIYLCITHHYLYFFKITLIHKFSQLQNVKNTSLKKANNTQSTSLSKIFISVQSLQMDSLLPFLAFRHFLPLPTLQK